MEPIEITKEKICKDVALLASFVDGGITKLVSDEYISEDTYKLIDEIITVAQLAITLYCDKKE